MHLFLVHVVFKNWLPFKGIHKAMHLPKFLMEEGGGRGGACASLLLNSCCFANMLLVEEYVDRSPFLPNNMRKSSLIDHP